MSCELLIISPYKKAKAVNISHLSENRLKVHPPLYYQPTDIPLAEKKYPDFKMPFSNLIRNIHLYIKDLLGPSVIDARLNQPRLALATHCYWFQSRILRIPDRFGFFAPGPPRLQVEESSNFIFLLLFLIQIGFYGLICIFVFIFSITKG